MSSHARTLVLVIATAIGLQAADTYSATVIDLPFGFPLTTGINNGGRVVGWVWNPGPDPAAQAFVYSGGTPTILLGASFAAINDSGQIAGQLASSAFPYSPQPAAALYTGGIATPLGFLPGRTQSWAAGINNSGQVVGYSDTPLGNAEAFLYSGGVMTGLGFLPGDTQSRATGINDSGQIVGWSTDASGKREAFLYSAGVMTGLGTLSGYAESVATAINDSGQVVGYTADSHATNSVPKTQAFLYEDGVMKGLGFLPGQQTSQANAINSRGQIVGTSGSGSAFLYSDGQIIDLRSVVTNAPQDLGPLSEVNGINDSGQIVGGNTGAALLLTPMQGRFVPVAPCRIADTRLAPGSFGGPALAAGAARSFPIPQSACGIPATAQAYALNVTVVPQGPLGYLTLWPTSMDQPLVSTLNSFQGSVVANAAIVPAGQNGAVSVYVTNPTDLILDIDGYFDATSGDSFYTVPPCRLADTRLPAGSSSDTLHGPSMDDHETRAFPVLSTSCGLPATAAAYSTNVTVIPAGLLSFLTTWATGQPQPLVSTLNALNGGIVANAAIVPAGTNGAVSVYVTNRTDVVLDTNGYFAPTGGTGGLTFYPVTPCRVADTREADGPFGGPVMAAATLRSFAIPASDCSIPATAAAYSLNVTAVPNGPLGFLTAWPTGLPLPFVSTLNSPTGTVVANAAIVPAGANGAVSVYVTNQTHVILDINGYFAP